jgi:predicted RNA-binding protein YlqC (UPF0109 family)
MENGLSHEVVFLTAKAEELCGSLCQELGAAAEAATITWMGAECRARRARLVSDDTVAELQSWVRAVVSELVTAPTTICVERIAETGPTVLLALRLDEGDLGRVIGRRGLIIQSLRSLVAAAGARRGLQVRLEVPQARSGRRADGL